MASWTRRAALAIALWAAMAGSAHAEQILVFAAASLEDALNALAGRFESATGHSVRHSYASSSTLARQIEQGAPADLYISANPQWMDYLRERSLIDADTALDLVSNELVLVAPRDSALELTIAPGIDLLGPLAGGRLAVADPDHVPAGIYARAALQSLGIWTTLEPRLARAANVRGALALVSSQAAPLGIVYRSDAVADRGVRLVGVFAPETHAPIAYPAAVVARSRSAAIAREFLDYLASPAAADIFTLHGFTPLD